MYKAATILALIIAAFTYIVDELHTHLFIDSDEEEDDDNGINEE